MTNEEGVEVDLSDKQVKDWCSARGILSTVDVHPPVILPVLLCLALGSHFDCLQGRQDCMMLLSPVLHDLTHTNLFSKPSLPVVGARGSIDLDVWREVICRRF